MPTADGALNPIELIEQKIASGNISRDVVDRARDYWRQHLAEGVMMPNGEQATITEFDLHHLLEDDRILRKPFRIGRALRGLFEMRTTHSERRVGLCEWDEEGAMRYGYVILEKDGRVRTMHLFDEQDLRKRQRRGERLWRRDV